MESTTKAQDSKGTTAIELALLLPFMILLIFGMLEFSLLLYDRQVLTNASREGARAGIVQTGDGGRVTLDSIASVVADYCRHHMITFGTPNPPQTTAEWPDGTQFGDNLVVTVTYDYQFSVLSAFGFGPLRLEALTVMKLE